MFGCKICNKRLQRGSGHIRAKHGISTLEYVEQCEGVLICEMYASGMSAQQICNEIKGRNIGVNPIKKDVLQYLRDNEVEIRSTSAAIGQWSARRGGPWNKGLTKEEHPSIAAYSASRAGKQNGYWTGPEESRIKTQYWKYKTTEELCEIRSRSGDTLKERYASGELISYAKLNPEWEKKNLQKRLAGYKRWQESGHKIRFGNSSKAEVEIANILEDLGVKYVRQFSPSKYRFDFYLPDQNLVLEYHGTYWHADPRKYEPSYYNVKKGKTAEEIWRYDAERLDYVRSLGYDTSVVWEEDFKRLHGKQKKDLINEIVESKVCK
jgi:G:T-mismatch repair DNA endonuclease (very short patch repair protein)